MRINRNICFCPKSIAWITRHLKASAKAEWFRMTSRISGDLLLRRNRRRRLKRGRKTRRKSTKHRTAKQRAATRKLIAFNRRRR